MTSSVFCGLTSSLATQSTEMRGAVVPMVKVVSTAPVVAFDGGETGAGDSVDRPDVATEVQVVAVDGEVAYPAGCAGVEARHALARGNVQLGDSEVGHHR